MVGKNGHQRAAEETECEQTRGQKRSVREADCRRSDRDCINPLPDCTVLYCTVLYCTVVVVLMSADSYRPPEVSEKIFYLQPPFARRVNFTTPYRSRDARHCLAGAFAVYGTDSLSGSRTWKTPLLPHRERR